MGIVLLGMGCDCAAMHTSMGAANQHLSVWVLVVCGFVNSNLQACKEENTKVVARLKLSFIV